MSSSSMSSSSAHQTPSEPHVPCHHNEREVRSSIPPADWVNHHTTTHSEGSAAQSHFEFFYHVIFTFVHSALTLLLAPVLKTTRLRRSRRSHRSSRSQQQQQQWREIQSFREVDPELAMVPPESRRVAASSSSSNNSSSSILKSHRRRSSGEQAATAMTAAAATGAAAKSVRFPEPKRSRPPLGRISSSIGSSSSTTSVGGSAASVSESSSSSSSSRSYGRGRIAPRYTLGSCPRTHHTTYFLSD
eukprot:CAMPEP_0201713556 /NCGR_PEP_ID=MMETSP0593-20130828/351_1 /ASSEMBLY_ACC=CAM_ASM_000672 /TAXON_ID=267983 /ORGANISM="Skeletonema japonicum, Strain CCMP2506" /LENGTH=244 /DNA_ID=CAMNT_0048202719 /DNA_START=100 /DNA_END=834 /DNA_ORIENTATION=+